MIYSDIERLIGYGTGRGLIEPEDVYVIQNQLIDVLGLNDFKNDKTEISPSQEIDDILKPLVDYACENKLIEDTSNSRDLFDTRLMGILTPLPHEVSERFYKLYKEAPRLATEWYYSFSKDTNYVRAGRMKRDLKWKYPCEYGELDITINRSKPEKDPRDIAAAKSAPTSDYPKCMLCAENAGFSGNAHRPARQNLRPVPMKIGGEDWFLQYSPYGYYNEHCIIFNKNHTPMKIDDGVFQKLFDITDILPHYFVGSNADLPIVGGSILSHEHFQGGHYTFPMETAPIEKEFTLEGFPKVKAGIVKWAMSVIRLQSEDREELCKACSHILKKWRGYSDESAEIFAESDGEPHNTITPIARKKGEIYECDLVLRNNRTSPERPLGLFHPNPSLFHIKKENIGLIEVMGLAVLPSRLAEELAALENALLSGEDLSANPLTASHAAWANGIKARRELSAENIRGVIREETGEVFKQVLLDAGVFKRDKAGAEAFAGFIDEL